MTVRPLHEWEMTPREAAALQNQLRKRLRAEPIRPWPPRWVASVDASYGRGSERVCAGVILFRLPEMQPVEQVWTVLEAAFPYVPGLLTWREGPAVVEAFRKLRRRPDAVLFDGQGRAHPRGLGLAAHLGLWLNLPTIGCAKSRLCGEAEEPGPAAGDHAPLRLNGRTIGRVLRTRDQVRPLFISAGHRCTLRDAVRLTLRCGRGYRLPEPTRAAHRLVTELRNEYEGTS